MAKDKRNNLGFDVDDALRALHAEAIKAGAVPNGDPRAESPLHTSMAHFHRDDQPTCKKQPCRIWGLCLALYELVQYRDELKVAAPFIEAADQTENLRRAILDAGVNYHETFEWFRTQSLEHHRLDSEFDLGLPRHNHNLLCKRPQQILVSLTALEVLVEHFEGELRELTFSFELQQSNHEKRSSLLLTAVYQQLKRGGITYSEIAELVPDELGKKGADERVRKRVKSPNACSLVPANVLATLKPEVEPNTTGPRAEATDPLDSSR